LKFDWASATSKATAAITELRASAVPIGSFHQRERFSCRMASSLLMHVGQLTA
jgi:hypothetical protein